MKRNIALILVLMLLLTSSFAFAETSTTVDTVTSATTWVEETSTTPVTVEVIPTSTGHMEYRKHVVVSGDVLWKIAQNYEVTLDQLKALNPMIKDMNMIAVGQEIIVKQTSVDSSADPDMDGYMKVYQGFGRTVAFRNGPGSDSEGVPVYSLNIAMASATFDSAGKILNVFIDGYEIATPNYDGASMPHFSGWPEKEGYNITDHTSMLVSGVSVNTEESAAAEVQAWMTKRQRGYDYHMNPENEWFEQMDFFQEFFVGKTVVELQAWFDKYTTTKGRPIKATTTKEADLAKFNLLTDTEKAELADVVSGATMSLSDAHGDFLGAVYDAYNNRVVTYLPMY